MNTAAKVADEKRRHPERFCKSRKCLWKVVTPCGVNPCQRHPMSEDDLAEAQRYADAWDQDLYERHIGL